jgi:hypothetical protein
LLARLLRADLCATRATLTARRPNGAVSDGSDRPPNPRKTVVRQFFEIALDPVARAVVIFA